MITDGEGSWYYLAIKSIPTLIRGVSFKHNGDFYCLNCFHSYRTSKKLKKHEKICINHDFCQIIMPNDDNEHISSVSGRNTLKNPFIIYADLECLLFKISSCENARNSSYTEKKTLHVPSGCSILTCYSFDKSLNE